MQSKQRKPGVCADFKWHTKATTPRSETLQGTGR